MENKIKSLYFNYAPNIGCYLWSYAPFTPYWLLTVTNMCLCGVIGLLIAHSHFVIIGKLSFLSVKFIFHIILFLAASWLHVSVVRFYKPSLRYYLELAKYY